LFGAPLRLLVLLAYPGTAISAGVAPRMVRSHGQVPAAGALSGALRSLLILQSLFLAPMIVWAVPIIHLILGARYSGSAETVRVLSISAYLGGFAPLVSLSVNYLGDARSRVPLMVGAALLDGLIDVILIPRIGIIAGAIATAAALGLMVGGHLAICRRHVKIQLAPLAVTLARTLSAAGVMAAVLLVVFGADPPVAELVVGGAAGTAAWGVTLLLTGEVSVTGMVDAGRRLHAGVTRRARRPRADA
jgi:O-antigen/teichoic acid export membrane protein